MRRRSGKLIKTVHNRLTKPANSPLDASVLGLPWNSLEVCSNTFSDWSDASQRSHGLDRRVAQAPIPATKSSDGAGSTDGLVNMNDHDLAEFEAKVDDTIYSLAKKGGVKFTSPSWGVRLEALGKYINDRNDDVQNLKRLEATIKLKCESRN